MEMDDSNENKVDRSTLQSDDLRDRLQSWLSKRVGAEVRILDLSKPTGSGMSSETLLLTVSVGEENEERAWVARLAPLARDQPVFQHYDLGLQFRLLEILANDTLSAPVPRPHWLELDDSILGTPFFVMDRIQGRVPPDVPPYPFAGWILDASDDERHELLESTVDAIAAVHAVRPPPGLAKDLCPAPAGTSSLRWHVQQQRAYYEWIVSDGIRHPLIERAFEWLDAKFPSNEGPPVISWGDARIGNVLYAEDGFDAVGLLDWEMAALGPRELDLGWLCFMHTFFQSIAEMAGQPGLSDFLAPSDVAKHYKATSGHELADLTWYYTYAATRHACIMARIHRRMVHFGQAEWGADPDAVILHRAVLEKALGDSTPASIGDASVSDELRQND